MAGQAKVSVTTISWLILVLVAGLVGLVAGANISQPMLVAQPTRDVLKQADQLDHVLLDGLQDPRNVGDEMHKLRERISRLPERQDNGAVADIDSITAKLADQNVAFQNKLWKAHEGISTVRLQLKTQADAASGPATTAYDQLRRFLKWTGPLLAFAILLLVVALPHPGVRRWFARLTNIGLGPVSLSVSDVSALKQGIRERFDEVDGAIVEMYKDKVARLDLEGLFSRLKVELDRQLNLAFGVKINEIEHRATLYVPGFTDEKLVQVTRYSPPQSPERPVGRRFSIRYGIIGRAFRLRTALYNWDVNNKQNSLVRNWGLTRSEAYKQGAHATSLMAFPIPPDQSGDPLGIIYLEARGVNLLMPDEDPSALALHAAGDPDGRTTADVLAHNKVWMPLWNSQSVQPLFEALQAMKAELNWDTPLRGQDGQ